MLRFLNDDTRNELQNLPQPEIAFLYLGRIDQAMPHSSFIRPISEPIGPFAAAAGRRAHFIEIHALVTQGRLEMRWTYSKNLHRQATIESLAHHCMETLRALVARCCSGDSLESVVDPSAFGWNDAEVQQITNAIARSLNRDNS
jgi:non-ribosomal peptide synthase protein (TIGR01720 family)